MPTSPSEVCLADDYADGQAHSPTVNMAIDSWMSELAPLESNQAMLRIYRWSPAGISIGRNQSWARALDVDLLGPDEVAIRRVTGGRAIYHDSTELTYSFATQIPKQGDPVVAQRYISCLIVESLLLFLRGAGINASVEKQSGYVPSHRANRQSPHCFVSAARHEITVDGRKIIASAQRVRAGRFFQHGSIKLAGVVSHPALFERPKKEIGQIGNKTPLSECYTSGEKRAACSYITEPQNLEPGFASERGESQILVPSELRSAFSATFGSALTSPRLNPSQQDEVLRLIADNDSIAANGEASKNISSLSRSSKPDSSHFSPHISRLTPHVDASC